MKVYARTPLNLDQVIIPRGQVFLIPDRCKGCRLCIQFCPKQVLRESTETNSKGYHYPEILPGMETACVNCEFCTMVCPEFAIFTKEILMEGNNLGEGA
jgi:2-oxoglutarate ferredoxin oxidoreductase subunit delta